MALIKIILAFCLVAVAFAVKVEDKEVNGDLNTDSSVGFGYSYGNIHPYGGIGLSKFHAYPHGYGSYYPGYAGYGYHNGYYPGFAGYPYGHGHYYGY